MGEGTNIIMGQVGVMFIIMAVGYLLYRIGFIDERGADQMSDLVLYVANPILIAQALMRDFDMDLLVGALWTSALVCLTLLVMISLGAIVYRGGSPHMRLGRFSMVFSNAGFIGIPLAQALVGPDGVFYISVANTVQTALLWTYGVHLVSGDKDQVSLRKVALNPALIAMVIGLACFVMSWRPPEVVSDALNALGSLNTGLVMLVLGAYLGQCDMVRVLTRPSVLKASLLRLVLAPCIGVVVLLCANALGDLGVLPNAGGEVWMSYLLYTSMPVAVIAALFAHQYGEDADFATGTVAASTLLSLVTLPVVVMASLLLIG